MADVTERDGIEWRQHCHLLCCTHSLFWFIVLAMPIGEELPAAIIIRVLCQGRASARDSGGKIPALGLNPSCADLESCRRGLQCRRSTCGEGFLKSIELGESVGAPIVCLFTTRIKFYSLI